MQMIPSHCFILEGHLQCVCREKNTNGDSVTVDYTIGKRLHVQSKVWIDAERRFVDEKFIANDCALRSITKLNDGRYQVTIVLIDGSNATYKTMIMQQKDAKLVFDWFSQFVNDVLQAIPIAQPQATDEISNAITIDETQNTDLQTLRLRLSSD